MLSKHWWWYERTWFYNNTGKPNMKGKDLRVYSNQPIRIACRGLLIRIISISLFKVFGWPGVPSNCDYSKHSPPVQGPLQMPPFLHAFLKSILSFTFNLLLSSLLLFLCVYVHMYPWHGVLMESSQKLNLSFHHVNNTEKTQAIGLRDMHLQQHLAPKYHVFYKTHQAASGWH